MEKIPDIHKNDAKDFETHLETMGTGVNPDKGQVILECFGCGKTIIETSAVWDGIDRIYRCPWCGGEMEER